MIFKCLLLLLLSQNLIGQNKARIMDQPNILWAGEFVLDFSLQNKGESSNMGTWRDSAQGRNEVYWIRQEVSLNELPGALEPGAERLSYKIYNKIIDYKKAPKLYKTAKLKVALSAEEHQSLFYNYDTITVFDPETFEEVEQYFGPNPKFTFRDLSLLQLHGYLYFDNSLGGFYVQPTAIGVKGAHYDNNGNFLDVKPLFWWPIEKQDSLNVIYESNVSWAKFVCRSVFVEKIKVLKEVLSFEETLQRMVENGKKGKANIYADMTMRNALTKEAIGDRTVYTQTVEGENNHGFNFELKRIQQEFTGKEVSELVLGYYLSWNGTSLSYIPAGLGVLQDQGDKPWGKASEKIKIVALYFPIK